jgi:hypothetical protein
VSSSQTLYAIADAVSVGPPSSVSQGVYLIGGVPLASSPTSSPNRIETMKMLALTTDDKAFKYFLSEDQLACFEY